MDTGEFPAGIGQTFGKGTGKSIDGIDLGLGEQPTLEQACADVLTSRIERERYVLKVEGSWYGGLSDGIDSVYRAPSHWTLDWREAKRYSTVRQAFNDVQMYGAAFTHQDTRNWQLWKVVEFRPSEWTAELREQL